MKFPHLEKFVDLMKDLKYEHQSIFPCAGGSNLILGIGRENQISFLRTLAAVKFFFYKIVKKWHFGVKQNSLSTQIHLYNPYRVPHTIP